MVLMGCRIRVGPLHIAGDICRGLLMHCGYRLTRQLYLSLRPGSYKPIAISDSQLSRDKIANQDTAVMKVVLKEKSW